MTALPPPDTAALPRLTSWAWGLVLLMALHVLWCVFHRGANHLLGADLLYWLTISVCVVLVFSLWREQRQYRVALSALLVAIAAQWLADSWMLLLDFRPESTPDISLADPFYFLYYLALAACLVRLQAVRLASRQAFIWLLSSLSTVSVVAELIWLTWLGSVVHASGSSLLFKALNVGYVLLDLLVLVLALLLPHWRRWNAASSLLLGGLLAFVLADLWYYAAASRDSYQPGLLLDSLWPLGLGAQVLGIAAFLGQRPVDSTADSEASSAAHADSSEAPLHWGWWNMLPYLAVGVSAALLAFAPDAPGHAKEWFTVLVMVLVSAQQALTMLENVYLNRTLQAQAQTLLQQRNELADLAFTDTLTGLPNRAAFNFALSRLVPLNTERAALFFIDLDGFKAVNDQQGHAAGDQLLRQVGERLAQQLSQVAPAARVYRIGGDEFTVLLPVVTAPQASELATALVDCLCQPFEVEGRTAQLSASVGLALAWPGQLPSELLQRADAAMYQAKQAGKNRWVQAGAGVGAVAATSALTTARRATSNSA